MRILVTGSRDWTDTEAILRALQAAAAGIDTPTLVHGDCPTGADRIADGLASDWGWQIERHPAPWKMLGKRAGPVRNQHMVNLGASVCLAFIKAGSRGASGCADMAQMAGIPTYRLAE